MAFFSNIKNNIDKIKDRIQNAKKFWNSHRRNSIESLQMQEGLAKIVTVFLALTCYGYYQFSTNVTRSLTLPLNIQFDKETAVLDSDVSSVRVKVRGSVQAMRRLKTNCLLAYAETSDFVGQRGKNEFPIFLQKVGPMEHVRDLAFKVVPDRVVVKYEECVTKEVPVKHRFSGMPEKDYKPVVRFFPSSVTVSGPKTLIEEIETVQAMPIDIQNQKRDFTRGITIEAIPRVTIEPSGITAQVSFTPPSTPAEQILINLPLKFIHVSSHLSIIDPKETFAIRVPLPEGQTLVDKMGELSLLVDMTEIDKEGKYKLPLQLVEMSAQEINWTPKEIEITLETKKDL